MRKAIIFASHITQVRSFCQQYNLIPHKDVFYVRDWGDCSAWGFDWPVILLEGYERNKNYTLGLMNLVGHRFNNIYFVSEGERFNEGVIV